jgi:hypothetical protein
MVFFGKANAPTGRTSSDIVLFKDNYFTFVFSQVEANLNNIG